MARFYGWTHKEMLALTADTFATYYRGYEIISAREALLDLKISCAPDMKPAARERIWKRLERQSGFANAEEVAMTPENLERLMNG